MGKARRTRKFAQVKRLLNPKDSRLKANADKGANDKSKTEKAVRRVQQISPALFFKYNTALGPPYHILIDTNFINASIQNRLEIVRGMMDCLLAKCTPCITDCVMGELEKLGPKYRLALRIAKDPRFKRLPCQHKVATCDKDLKRRLRKVPGVPIMFIRAHKYAIERLPDVPDAPYVASS